MREVKIVQVSKVKTFAVKAEETGAVVTLVPTATVVPVQIADVLVMQPALSIECTMEFEDAVVGPVRWVFREVLLADDRGLVPLANTAWQRLAEHVDRIQVVCKGLKL